MQTIIFDFSRTLLFPIDKTWTDSLNKLNKKLSDKNPNYDFLNYFYLNEDLLDYLSANKDKFELYIFTTGTVQNNLVIISKLKSIFKHIFTVEEVGFEKNSEKAYLKICQKLNQKPEQIIFIDDEVSNLNAAKKVGLQTIQYTSNQKLFKDLIF